MTENVNQPKSEDKAPRMVNCVKLGQELPGLEQPPFGGDLGERIYENVSHQAWDMWLEQQVILINHYGLNMADPSQRAFLVEQCEEFFFGEEAAMPEGWTPPGADGKGGGPQQKGGGPQQKK
jgi:Fe-S cluster biosynthesis and repair protein YggX